MRISDGSSDVCSSDLILDRAVDRRHVELVARRHHGNAHAPDSHLHRAVIIELLLEEAPLRRALFGHRRRELLPPRLARRLARVRSQVHTSDLLSLIRISYAVFCFQLLTLFSFFFLFFLFLFFFFFFFFFF